MSLDPQLADWIRLCHAPGVGPVTLRKLLATFGLPHEVFAASTHALAAVVGDRLAYAVASGAPPSTIDRALAWVDRPGRHILTLIDADYPQALLDTPDPPPLLYVEGRVELLNRPAVAIVGSRSASAQGLANAEAFARELSAAGLTIVSGLALGIDGRAHRGGLDAIGSSLGVVGTGLDIVYPRRHRALFEAMRADGVIVAECPLGTPPIAGNFPRRNRLISGLARGCLVIEAAIDSGSLITARIAADQGRDVFALPGSIHSPLAKGCHALIKQGAMLVDTADDVLDALGFTSGFTSGFTRAPRVPITRPSVVCVATQTTATDHDDSSRSLLESMGFDPVQIDVLCMRLGLTPDVVSAMLSALELDGVIAAVPGGGFQRQA